MNNRSRNLVLATSGEPFRRADPIPIRFQEMRLERHPSAPAEQFALPGDTVVYMATLQ